jgi:hypothetical protein
MQKSVELAICLMMGTIYDDIPSVCSEPKENVCATSIAEMHDALHLRLVPY